MNWKENNLIRRVIMAFLGNYIISFGISFLYAADFVYMHELRCKQSFANKLRNISVID